MRAVIPSLLVQRIHIAVGTAGADFLAAVPWIPDVHYHKKNEEIYFVISGKGQAIIDGETVELAAGDWLRVAPKARRQFSAAADEGISFICIQVRENSLEEYTADDAEVEK